MRVTVMEVECVKYGERMDSELAVCRHPGDYCKFRSSCIIHFLGSDKGKGATVAAPEPESPELTEENDKHDG